MKKAIIIMIVVLTGIHTSAQILTGIVYDKATKLPVPGVHVYLDGTSFADATTNSGRYTLSVKQAINTRLVFSHLAYETIIIENPFIKLPDTIYIEERLNLLGEVTVQSDPFSRKQKLKAFREQFLGQTPAGRSCKILNEDDIQVWFNVALKTLFASSEYPIEIINEYLDYRIMFLLIDFSAEYSDVSLNPNRMQKTYYLVTSSYEDLTSDDKKITRRRDNIYEVSSKNFFKNLAYDPYFDVDSLKKHTFRIYNRYDMETNVISNFIIKDTLSLKIIHIAGDNESINPTNPWLRITVSNRNSEYPTSLFYSKISFFTDALLVDKYGNIDQIEKVIFSGQMGFSRAGDMLPVDYEAGDVKY